METLNEIFDSFYDFGFPAGGNIVFRTRRGMAMIHCGAQRADEFIWPAPRLSLDSTELRARARSGRRAAQHGGNLVAMGANH